MVEKENEMKRNGSIVSRSSQEDFKENDKNVKKNHLTIKHLNEDWLGNVKTFDKIIKDPDNIEEISRITEKEYPAIHEYQKKLAKMVLKTFPGIEKQFRDENLEFHARILRIPFYRRSRNLQHSCIQKHLAEKQGEINIATGSNKILADTLYVDMPVLAPEAKGDALLFNQKKLLEDSMPSIQRECLVKAQPVAVANRVYDYCGRWLIWRMLFDLNKAEELGRRAEAAPLYAQKLTDFRLSNLFPFAGTMDGELALIVMEKNEENHFKDGLGKMKEEFGLETEYIDTEIAITWESIVGLGILPYAAEPHLSQVGRVFKQKLGERILKDVLVDFGSFTEKNNVSEHKNENGILKGLSDLMAIEMTSRGLESVFRISQKVPESLMKSYEIKGGGRVI